MGFVLVYCLILFLFLYPLLIPVCKFASISEKVRQIQDKLEEFIQALNKEK